MKLIKEHINEKFIEDSDPIKDLRIGGVDIMSEVKKMFKSNDKHEVSDETIQKARIFLDTFLNKKISGKFKKGFYEAIGYYEFIPVKYETYFAFSQINFRDGNNVGYQIIPKERYVVSSVFEKFIEDSDPIKDLGIGLPSVGSIISSKDDVPCKGNIISIISTKHPAYRMLKDNLWLILEISSDKKTFTIKIKAVENLQHAEIYMDTKTDGHYIRWHPFYLKLTYKQFKEYFKIII